VTLLATGLSSLARSFFAPSSILINQAKIALHFVYGKNPAFSSIMVAQPFFGQVNIFKVIEVLKYSLADVVGFGSPCGLGQIGEPFFDFTRKPYGKHFDHLLLYMYFNSLIL
jgi:hypothetical protein